MKRVFNVICLLFFFTFCFWSVSFYFSDINIKNTNKIRSLYSVAANGDLNYLPLLENDTNNIIVYSDEIEIYKKEKKDYSFWDLIKK